MHASVFLCPKLLVIMSKRIRLISAVAIIILLSAVFAAISGSGLLSVPDGYLSDALYQSTGAADGEKIGRAHV